MLVAVGVLGNVEGLFAESVKVEIVKNHIKADPEQGYVTSVPGWGCMAWRISSSVASRFLAITSSLISSVAIAPIR